MRGLFITGTDTGVGKTVIAAAIARCLRERGYRVGVCKPVATGAQWQNGLLLSSDTVLLAQASGLADRLHEITPYVFAEPCAPSVAARHAGRSLSLDDILDAVRRWSSHCDILLVEGIGGLLCPLTEQASVADLAHDLQLPILVVARTRLGTLNHTLLTTEAILRRRLPWIGVLLNEADPPTHTLAELTVQQELTRLGIPILALVRHRPAEQMQLIWPELAAIDWYRLANKGSIRCTNSVPK